MSVRLNIRPLSNEDRWKSVKNGDFVLLDGSPEHPLPNGLYRVFHMPNEGSGIPDDKTWFIVPMGDGPFADGFYPYAAQSPLPPLKQVIGHVNIDVITVEQ